MLSEASRLATSGVEGPLCRPRRLGRPTRSRWGRFVSGHDFCRAVWRRRIPWGFSPSS